MADSTPSFRIGLPKFLWIYLPVLLSIYFYAVCFAGYEWENKREFGVIDNGTAVLLAIAVVYGVRLALRAPEPIQRYWFWVITAGAVYFLGEEISWGQHLLGWATPDAWEHMNKQSETNLHNLSGFYNIIFSRLPRGVLLNGAFFCGFIIPALMMWRGTTFPPTSINHWIWPSYTTGVAAVIAILSSLPVKAAGKLLNDRSILRIDHGELKECMLALFILLYVMASYRYFSKASPSAAAAAGKPQPV